MASSEDYIGKNFGRFQIVEQMAQGAEAEVFVCADLKVGRSYILRLDAHDDDLWDGDPVIPPKNYTLESKNAHGTWFMTPGYRKQSFGSEFKFRTVPIYGILDSRYFVPVASPFRVKGAWNVDRLLSSAPADDLLYFELWEDLALHMLSDAHNVDSGNTTVQEWKRRWGLLAGGEILTSAVKRYMEAGSLNSEARSKVLDRISIQDSDDAELAENLILRLCGSLSRGRMTHKEATATLACRHFRINITIHELKQAVLALETLKELSGPLTMDDSSIKLLTWVLVQLGEEPIDEWEKDDRIVQLNDEPDTQRFSLFLQERADVRQQIPTLEVQSR